jgi:pimeloyl-ACP methyl ester carboxylesterase
MKEPRIEPKISLGRTMFKIILGLIVVVALILIHTPLLLAPLVTSVSVPMWVGLILAEIILIAITVKRFKTKSWIWGVEFITNILVIVLSQVLAVTPPIRGTDGKKSTGSIAVLEKVKLNGSEQWITIRGKDTGKPILLYLGIGGPGAGGFPATFTSLKPLEDHFVVVNWDQPGTGKSYGARNIKELTTQTFVDDAYELINLMRARFKQEKVYVMGLSWGTIVGINLVQQHPEVIKAYVGNGQMVNTTENDRYGYELAVRLSEEQGNTKTLSKLREFGAPPYEGKNLGIKYTVYNDVLFKHMDSPTIPMIMLLVPQLAKEYGYIDKINFDRGLYESFTTLYPQLRDLDFIKQVPKLNVPVYFLAGEKDVNAVSSIVERYYNILEAPKKKLVWLKSGHGATAEELRDILVNQVLSN